MSLHLRLPLALGADGSFQTVEEDSLEEIVQNIGVVLRTRLEERLATPDLGTPDPMGRGFDAPTAFAQVAVWEDRATEELVEQVLIGSQQFNTVAVRKV